MVKVREQTVLGFANKGVDFVRDFTVFVNEEIEKRDVIIDRQAKTIESLSNKQRLVSEGFKDTEILPVSMLGKSGPRNKGPEEMHDETSDFMGITPQANGYNIVIHYRSPETGKDTTMHRVRATFEDALIARNEIIATLRKSNLIDLDKFIKVMRN